LNKLAIEAFLAVVETKNFSKACERLFVSQSTISNRLSCLEKELGSALFKRAKGMKGVELTPKGKEFLTYANRYVSLEKDVRSWSRRDAKYDLKITAPPSLNAYILLPLFDRILEKQYPICLNIYSHWIKPTYELIESQQMDIGIVSLQLESQNAVTTPLFREEMVLISGQMSSDLPDIVDPECLKTDNEVFLSWGAEFKMWHDSHWSPAGVNPLLVDSPYLIYHFVKHHGYWSIVPYDIALKFKENMPLKISRFSCQIPYRTIYKVLHRNPNSAGIPAIRIFEKELNAYIEENRYTQKI